MDARWNSALPADFGERLVAGPAGQGLRRQRQVLPARPRRGQEAAGGRRQSNGVNVKSNRITDQPVADLARYAEALEAMALDAGFKCTVVAEDYNTVYIPKIRDGSGQYEGIGWHTVTGTTPWRMAPASALAVRVLVQGRRHLQGLQHQRQERQVRRPGSRLR